MEQLIFMKPKPRVNKVKKKGNQSTQIKFGSYTMFLRIYQAKVLVQHLQEGVSALWPLGNAQEKPQDQI